MNKIEIEKIVYDLINEYCELNSIEVEIDSNTALIGSNRIMNSLGLVNIIVDIETRFLDDDIEINLASETAMSSRISPYRTVGSLCSFIEKQININNE